MTPTTPRAPRSRTIALLKPDFGVAGGFERVATRVEGVLRADGHEVTRITVDLPALAHRPFGLAVPDHVWLTSPEYFRYTSALEAFDRIDTRRFDAVVSTQPPSFGHTHPRHLSLFFHHQRVFYDLEEVWIEAGFAPDVDLHRRAAAHIRRLDATRLDRVSWFLAGSESVRRRLGRFNGIDRVSLFHAGIGLDDAGSDSPRSRSRDPVRTGAVLCVGRLEFPKRTELFVAAMKRLPSLEGVIVGTGGRDRWLAQVDHELSAPSVDLEAVDERALWCSTGQDLRPIPDAWSSNVRRAGWVDDDSLIDLYARSPCVVAPALAEDYGLTAVEAMAHGAPAVVCDDGGGLADLVTHEVDGLVVEPTGAALAAAVERITSDADLAATLSHGARVRAARTTWARADLELRTGLAAALDDTTADDTSLPVRPCQEGER